MLETRSAKNESKHRKMLVLYQYYHPDDVVSAQLYRNFCEDMARRRNTVETWPCNRSCHDSGMKYTCEPQILKNVTVHRVWRPGINPHHFVGRLFNSIILQTAWLLRIIQMREKPNVIVIGSDPIFAVCSAWLCKLFLNDVKIVHWCFDVHPEAALADGVVSQRNPLVSVLNAFLKKGYSNCDLLIDIGPCMRGLISKYPSGRQATITPWALEEPSRPLPINTKERSRLFGSARIGLLYSGSFGRAHEFKLTLQLARRLRENSVAVTYGVRGSRLKDLKGGIRNDDTNIKIVGFATDEQLRGRLSATDIHIVSLRESWVGTVVPSKFFGALSVGRPVIFEGPEDSSIAYWVKKYKVGWVLSESNIEQVAKGILRMGENPRRKDKMFKHCHFIYEKYFSKKKMLERWDREVKSLSKQIMR